MTTVPNVADGQLISTSWGNTVAAVVNAEVVRKDGATMTAPLVLPAADPTGANQAARKGYVDAAAAGRLNVAGGVLSGNLDMAHNFVINLPNPTAAEHAARKSYVDSAVNSMGATKVSVAGDGMTGTLNMNNNTVYGLPDPTGPTQAATLQWCNGRFALKAALDDALAKVAALESAVAELRAGR